jgi:hypothetical protein
MRGPPGRIVGRLGLLGLDDADQLLERRPAHRRRGGQVQLVVEQQHIARPRLAPLQRVDQRMARHA